MGVDSVADLKRGFSGSVSAPVVSVTTSTVPLFVSILIWMSNVLVHNLLRRRQVVSQRLG